MTALELVHDKIPGTLITDSMAGMGGNSSVVVCVMRDVVCCGAVCMRILLLYDSRDLLRIATLMSSADGKVDAVVVGADRVAANGLPLIPIIASFFVED